MTKIFLTVVFLLGVCAVPAFSQSEEEIKGLRRDLDAVRDSLKVIQNELGEIKKLLQQRPAAAPQAQPFQGATISIDGGPTLGSNNAKVTLIEFSDYQCPFCKRNFQQTFPEIDKEYIKTGKVKYVFRAFPLETIHPAAFKAAEAALCGGEQGKYWEMHDKLFTNQNALAPANLLEYAKSVGLDGGKFQACLDSGRQAATIRKDMAEGRKAGVAGTPGFFLGLTQANATVRATKFINGAQPYASFKDAIEQLLAAK